MSTVAGSWSSPKIVRDGLVLYLDANAPNSYSPYFAPTTWKDLSNNSNNGTLTNGPVFDPGNGGSISFDFVNDLVDTSITKSQIPTTSDVTFEVWAYPTNNLIDEEWLGISNINSVSPNYHNVVIGRYTDNKVYFNNYDGSEHRVYSNSAILNNWYHVVGIRRSNVNYLYINGVQQTQTLASGTPNIGTSITFKIGKVFYYYKGKFALTSIYNRALTAAEVLQNYNATKTRFGL
jgi:hypothetical protein